MQLNAVRLHLLALGLVYMLARDTSSCVEHNVTLTKWTAREKMLFHQGRLTVCMHIICCVSRDAPCWLASDERHRKRMTVLDRVQRTSHSNSPDAYMYQNSPKLTQPLKHVNFYLLGFQTIFNYLLFSYNLKPKHFPRLLLFHPHQCYPCMCCPISRLCIEEYICFLL